MGKHLLLSAVLLVLLCGCSAPGEETVPPISSEPIATTTESKPTEPATIPQATEQAEPAFPCHSGIRPDGSFDEGTLFIGDSLTREMVGGYLKRNGLLGDARYMATPGAAITSFGIGPRMTRGNSLCSPEFEGLLMCEAVKVAGEQTTAVYFMMGTNYSEYATDQMYIDAVQCILDSCPNATVYLQLVPYETHLKLDYVTANERVKEACFYFALRGNQRVKLIDTKTPIGYNLAYDGVHLTPEGNARWYEALVAYAKENNIPQ